MNKNLTPQDIAQVSGSNSFELSLLSSGLKIGSYLKMKMSAVIVGIIQNDSMSDEKIAEIKVFNYEHSPISEYVAIITTMEDSLEKIVGFAQTLLSNDHVKAFILGSVLNAKAVLNKESELFNSEIIAQISGDLDSLFNFLDNKSMSYSCAVIDEIDARRKELSIDARNVASVTDSSFVIDATVKIGQPKPQTANEMFLLSINDDYKSFKASNTNPAAFKTKVKFVEGDDSTYPPEGVFVITDAIPTLPAIYERSSGDWLFAEVENDVVSMRSYLFFENDSEDLYWHEIAFKG